MDILWLPKRIARRTRKLVLVSSFFLALLYLNANYLLSSDPTKGNVTVYFPIVSPEGLVAYNKRWVGFPDLGHVMCAPLFQKTDPRNLYAKTVPRIGAPEIALDSKNCSAFRLKYGFNRYTPVTKEEKEFPLAYILLFHKDLQQVLFFLRAIYRPHNVHCLNVDLDSGATFINAVRAFVQCLPNVFLVGKLESIVYSGYSRLQADINCMEELTRHPVRWKYLHNMPGQQFPLRTNLEIVKILKLYRGLNDFHGVTSKRSHTRRYKIKHHLIYDNSTGKHIIAESAERKLPPPHNFKIVKGSTYGSFTRDFVDFVLNDQRVKDLLEWSKDVESPDEYVFPTVHYTQLMDVPGGIKDKGARQTRRFLASFAAWEKQTPCASIYVRWICIFSPADLPMLLTRHELFANKFYIDLYPAALHCLDQYLYNLTVSITVRNLDFYKHLNLLELS